MSKKERDALIQAVTNDNMTSQFIADLGQKARVERSTITNEHMDELRGVIADVGRDLERAGVVPKGLEYMGSMSVHIYYSHLQKLGVFATVNEVSKVSPELADGALRELTGNTMEVYGKKRQLLRSGF